LKVGVNFASEPSEKISDPTLCIPGGHETEYYTVFVIVTVAQPRGGGSRGNCPVGLNSDKIIVESVIHAAERK